MWWPISSISSVGELGFAAASLPGMKTARVTSALAAHCNWECLLYHGQERLAHGDARQEALEPSGEDHVDRPCTGHVAPQSDAIICWTPLAPGQPGPFVMPHK